MRSLAVLIALSALSAAAADEKPLSAFGLQWKKLGGHWEVVDGALVGSAGNAQCLETFTDGVLELDVELLEGPPDRDLGVAFRFDNPGGDVARGTGYALNYTHAKTYRLLLGSEGKYVDLPATADKKLFDAKKNHLKVTMTGAKFVLELNGKPFAQFEDNAIAHGSISLWVDSMSNKVKFSNLTFKKR